MTIQELNEMFPPNYYGNAQISDLRQLLTKLIEDGDIGGPGGGGDLKADGSVPMDTGYTPTNDQDISTKKYVDDKAGGIVTLEIDEKYKGTLNDDIIIGFHVNSTEDKDFEINLNYDAVGAWSPPQAGGTASAKVRFTYNPATQNLNIISYTGEIASGYDVYLPLDFTPAVTTSATEFQISITPTWSGWGRDRLDTGPTTIMATFDSTAFTPKTQAEIN